MLLIYTTEDYADEFDYPVVSLFPERERDFLLANPELIHEDYEYYFGTNEALELSSTEIIDMISKAKEITPEEIKVLTKFSAIDVGLDIIDCVLEEIGDDEINAWYDTNGRNYDEEV